MAHKHICQGPECPTYDTQSRVRGVKGAKVLRTRNAYGDSDSWDNHEWYLYFCDERCMNDWLKEHIANFMNIVGIKTKPQETPVEVIKEREERKDYQGNTYIYTDTTINILPKQTNDDNITA